MRFAHLSDLHLGKRVNEFSMVEDQRYILKEITEIIGREKVEAVLIAGDVYDKTIPSAEAVQLLDEFLTGLAKMEIPVCMISGNHDSAERLSFGAALMENSRIYISPVYDGKVEPVQFTDEYGEVNVWLLPFLKPQIVRHALGNDEIITYQDAVAAAVEKLVIGEKADIEVDKQSKFDQGNEHGQGNEYGQGNEHDQQNKYNQQNGRIQQDAWNQQSRNILVAHQFVTGAARCDSEELSIGGLDNVDAATFDAFDYVALGHIHGPQHVGRDTVRYCGTPLKYSFSEANHHKSVTIIDLKEKGNIQITPIPLKPLRDMRKLRGTYMELTARAFYQETNTEDYIHITLTDEEDIPNGMEKLRCIYPNLMRLEYDNRRTRENQTIEGIKRQEERSELELFEEFFVLQNNKPLGEEQREFLRDMIEKQKEARL